MNVEGKGFEECPNCRYVGDRSTCHWEYIVKDGDCLYRINQRKSSASLPDFPKRKIGCEMTFPDVVKISHPDSWFRVYSDRGIIKLEIGNQHLNLGVTFAPEAAELYNLGKLFLRIATGERSWPCEHYYPRLEGLAPLLDFQRDCEATVGVKRTKPINEP